MLWFIHGHSLDIVRGKRFNKGLQNAAIARTEGRNKRPTRAVS